LIGANGGLFGGNREGVTHQFFEDLGILSSIPGVTLLAPADGTQVKKAVIAAVDIPGPVYIRIGSGSEEKVFSDDEPFEPGKVRIVVRFGSDAVVFAYGFILNRALQAAEILHGRGIHVTVVEVHTIKPLDAEAIRSLLRETGAAVTVEDHNIHGGLGSAVAAVSAERAPTWLVRLGLKDLYPESGHPEELLDKYGLGVADIVAGVETVVGKKNQRSVPA
jgi:transketolase